MILITDSNDEHSQIRLDSTPLSAFLNRINEAEIAAATSAAAAISAASAAAVSEGLADADRVSTNADVVTTAQDAIDTAADAVATAADVISAAASAAAAEAAASASPAAFLVLNYGTNTTPGVTDMTAAVAAAVTAAESGMDRGDTFSIANQGATVDLQGQLCAISDKITLTRPIRFVNGSLSALAAFSSDYMLQLNAEAEGADVDLS